MNKKHLVLLLCAALIVIVPLAIHPTNNGGSDDIAANEIQKSGYEPWFNPLWEPSGGMENLLFAVQAAIGLIIIGGFIGYYRKKQKS